MMRRYACMRVALIVLAGALAAGALGQSINVDLDIFAGDEQNGNGSPSDGFGAAASSPGRWNRVLCTTSGPWNLVGLNGQATSVVLTVTGNGLGGGSNYPVNTGDYARLLNDYARIPDQMTYRFTGLVPGRYLVYTYAIDATGAVLPVEVSVPGALTPNPQMSGQAVMPGNSFVLGVTHSIHELDVQTGSLEINLRNHFQGPPNASVNGFQIVAVPEPGAVATLSTLFILSLRRRRMK